MKKSEVQVGKWYYYEFGYGVEQGRCVGVGEDKAVLSTGNRWLSDLILPIYFCRIISECPAPEPPKPNWFSRLWSHLFG